MSSLYRQAVEMTLRQLEKAGISRTAAKRLQDQEAAAFNREQQGAQPAAAARRAPPAARTQSSVASLAASVWAHLRKGKA